MSEALVPSDRRPVRAWRCLGLVLGAVLLGPGGLAAAEEEGNHLPLSVSGMEAVAEEELSPTLESNRQPLGPDPLALPQWSAVELAAFAAGRPVNLGGGLWTAERYPLQPVPPWPEPMVPEAAIGPGVLGWDLLSLYGAARHWCVDPQGLLSADRRDRLEHHLAAHARSSGHPVRLWLLGPGQSLASALDDDTLHRASFGGDLPGVLAIMPAADPLAARLVLPPALAPQARSWAGPVIARIDLRAAPGDQLDQLALWLTLEVDSLPSLATSGLAALEARPGPPAGRGAFSPVSWSTWGMVAAGLATMVFGGVWAMRRHRRRPSPAAPVTLISVPATDLTPRLGGPYSGGSGAVLKW
jgi:hypothetical protein